MRGTVYVLAMAVGDFGGAPRATRLLCEGLVDLGYSVRLFVTARPQPATRRVLEALGIGIVGPVTNRGCRWDVPERMLALRLFWEARRNPPLLIHSVGLMREARYLMQLPRVAAPLYLWESTEALPQVKFVDRKIASLLHRADVVLAPSSVVERNVRSTYRYRGPIVRLPFWVEAPKVAFDAHHERTRNFLYIGRFDMDKGFRYLFEAFRQVHANAPQATLTVCGSGAVDEVRALASGIEGIDIRGYIDADEYERALAHCDCMVLASLHEGYPLSLLEACARARPVISTSVGSIPEVFGGRPCALLAPPADAAAFADRMQRLLAWSDGEYHARAADARRLFEEVSAPEIVRARLADAYRATRDVPRSAHAAS